LPTGRGSNLTSKAPNSEPGWCFKFHAKNCGISIGRTFCPIELKIGVLPIYVIQNQKKYQKIRAKSAKFGFLLVA
jgi:hypothetical protein